MSALLTERLGVFTSRASVVRIGVWTVLAVVAVSWWVAPDRPQHFDREITADVPPSSVRYVAPLTQNDLAGFLAPAARDDEFNVAWIGGSEVKLESVSLPGEFSQRVGAVGGRPIVIDAYTSIGMRVVDTYRAGLSAIDNGADALVVALNPSYTNDEFGLAEYANLAVSDPLALARDVSTLPAFVALTSPGDAALGLLAETAPLVDNLDELNERQRDWFDDIDILREPAERAAPDVDDRLPDDTASFWIRHEMEDLATGEVVDRVRAITQGFGVGATVSTTMLTALVDAADDAGVPVFLYATPLSPDFALDPANADTVAAVAAHWTDFADATSGRGQPDQVVVEPSSFTTDLPADTAFFDPVHIVSAVPVAELFVQRLCAHWPAFDPELECS